MVTMAITTTTNISITGEAIHSGMESSCAEASGLIMVLTIPKVLKAILVHDSSEIRIKNSV